MTQTHLTAKTVAVFAANAIASDLLAATISEWRPCVRIVNDALLASFRHPGKCSWCGKSVRMLCAAHIFARGHGGGRQIDAPFNLVALGADAVWDCSCHVCHHAGQRPKHCDLLAVAAAQNKCHQRDIEQLIYLIRRLDRHTTREQLFAAIERECRPTARELAMRTLR